MADIWRGRKQPTLDVVNALEGLWQNSQLDLVLGAGDSSNGKGEPADYYEKTFNYFSRLAKGIPHY